MNMTIENIELILMKKIVHRIGISIIVLAVAILYFLSFHIKYNDIQTRRDASGMDYAYASKFFYFYYYTGNFPLATLNSNLVDSKQGAKNEIEQHGSNLIMEYKHWSRLGEHARIFVFMPEAWLHGKVIEPSTKLFNALFFLFGLLSVFRGFYKIGKPLMGSLLVVALLSTPYFHYEVFQNQNIFALQASIFFCCMGIMLPFYNTQKSNLKILISISSCALLIAFGSEIRNEISILMLSCVLFILVMQNLRVWNKLIFISVALIFFWIGKQTIKFYFDSKYNETALLVAKHGGHVYNGKRIDGHKIWHPIFCGLGDFDTKYGYEWKDEIAYKYAVPILNHDYHLNINYSGKLYTDNFYDSSKIYYQKFDEIPEYEHVVKSKVIHDITSDPLWYLNILWNRIIAICSTTLPFPYLGFLALTCIYFFIKNKKWFYINLLLISLPLSITSLVIYSGRGATYNSMFGYFILVFVVYDLIQDLLLNKTLAFGNSSSK